MPFIVDDKRRQREEKRIEKRHWMKQIRQTGKRIERGQEDEQEGSNKMKMSKPKKDDDWRKPNE